MVAAVSTTITPKTAPKTARNPNPSRRPLIPSDPDNAVAPRRPKSREVTSRYMSSSSSSSSTVTTATNSSITSKRCSSPLISRPTAVMAPTPPSAIKRSQSVERWRAGTPRSGSMDSRIGTVAGGGELSNAQRMLITSTRSLSVSFQGESFAFQVSKAKPAPSPSTVTARKGTPEGRRPRPTPARDQTENSRPLERWPGRLRQERQPNSMSKSMDFSDDQKRLSGSGVNGSVVRAFQDCMIDNRSSSVDSRLSSDSSNRNSEKPAVERNGSVPSDTESVSSSSTSEGNGQAQLGSRVVVAAAARLRKDANAKTRRNSEPGSPVFTDGTALKVPVPSKFVAPRKFGIDSPVSSPKGILNSRGQVSPIRGGALRAASPSKLGMSSNILSPMRGVSPSRVRNNALGGVVGSTNISNLCATPSILSVAADIRRGKNGDNQILEVHLSRIVYNRLLQWRFANARADTALLAQKLNAEKNLYGAWLTTSKLRESVKAKRTELHCLRHNLKLISVLKGQMTYLEEWARIEQNYSCSASEAIESLQASTLRLPVVGGARADVQNLKDAICSAMDVMQAMASSICSLLSKVGAVNSLVGELANMTTKECALLDQCKDLLSTIAAMQVKESSMRAHVLQVERLPPSLTAKV